MFVVVSFKKLLVGTFCVLAVAVAVFGFFRLDAVGLTQGREIREVGIHAVETQEEKVAITFNELSQEVLTRLGHGNIRVTFFVTGVFAQQNDGLIKSAIKAGHEIGILGHTGANLRNLTNQQIMLELETAKRVVSNVTGEKVRYFRPQFGFERKSFNIANKLGLTTIMYSSSSLQNLQRGSIVLVNENIDAFVAKSPVSRMKFVTLSQLLK